MNELELELSLATLRVLQLHTSVPFRHRIGKLIAEQINGKIPYRPADDAAAERQARLLEEEGCVRLGQVLTADQAATLRDYFLARPCYDTHVRSSGPETPLMVGQGAERFHYGSYPLSEIVAAPYLLEVANNPLLIDIVARYLGCTPTLYSLNAWWSFPGHGKANTPRSSIVTAMTTSSARCSSS